MMGLNSSFEVIFKFVEYFKTSSGDKDQSMELTLCIFMHLSMFSPKGERLDSHGELDKFENLIPRPWVNM